MARRRLTVQEAAEALGTSVDAPRSRILRGSVEPEKDADGRVFVWLGGDQAGDQPRSQGEGSSALYEELREERRANDENRRLLFAALERIPAIEAPEPPGATESPEETSEAPSEGETTWVETEEDPLDLYAGTAAQAGMEAIRHVEEAVLKADSTVLRYGWFYGPGATDDLVEPVRRRRFPLVGAGTGQSSWVHLDDAASTTVLAVEQEASGVFNIVDDEPAPASEWLPYLAACAGAKPPMRVPRWLVRLLAGEVAAAMMTEGRGFSNARARRELGWKPRYPSWRQGFKEGLS